MTLLLALLAVQATYEERARAVDAAIVAERLRIASVFESLKAWGWARDEYRKVLRLFPGSDVAGKLSPSEGIPLANEKGLLGQRYHELTVEVAKVAAARHAELARWCQENGRPDQAMAHWRWTLLYSPAELDAIAALGLVGSGASARDPLWKKEPWKVLDAFDAGKKLAGSSDLEKKWKAKTLKRRSGDIQYESLGLSEAHVAGIVRQTNGVMRFLRDALGDAALQPYLKRYVLLADPTDYLRYIDDFTRESEARKKILKFQASGHWNKDRGEYAQCSPDESDQLEHVLAGQVAMSALWAFIGRDEPDWLYVGTASASEILFRGACEVPYFQIPEGTQDGELREARPEKWQADLLALVRDASDPPFEGMLSMQMNSMKPVHAVKCASIVRFLMLRWPHLYRSLALAQRDAQAPPRLSAERALGMTLEELDDFWRRWIMTQ